MAAIMGGVFTGPGLALWYHFAIMFEAVFIRSWGSSPTRSPSRGPVIPTRRG
jgi:carbon starvation protein CstA